MTGALILAAAFCTIITSAPAEISFPAPGDACYDPAWGDVAVLSPSGPPTCRIWIVLPHGCAEIPLDHDCPCECEVRPDPCGDGRWLFWTVRPVLGGIVMFSFTEPGVYFASTDGTAPAEQPTMGTRPGLVRSGSVTQKLTDSAAMP